MQSLREIKLAGALGAAVVALGSFAAFSHFHINPVGWTLWAGVLWVYCWWQTWRRRHLNRPDMTAPDFPDFGWPNRLTLLRGGLIALTGGFLFQPLPTGAAAWLPGILYGMAATLDRIDGLVARRTGRSSLLGKELDTEMDAVGLLVAPLLAVAYGKLHWSFLVVSAAYYVFIGGLRWRHSRQLPVYPLPPSALRRALAGFHMGFVALVLLPIFSSAATQLLGVAFMLPMLMGFLVDWLAVSGKIIHQGEIHVFFHRLPLVGRNIFQPGLRVVIALLVFFSIADGADQNSLIVFMQGILALLILTGLGARLAAGILLVVYAYGPANISWHSAALLFACSWLILLGAGNFSLWRGDDTWVHRQD